MKHEGVQGKQEAVHEAAVSLPMSPPTANANAEKGIRQKKVSKIDHGNVSTREMSTTQHHAGWCGQRWHSFEDVPEVLRLSTQQQNMTFGVIKFCCLHDADFNLVALANETIVQTVRW